MPASRSQRRRDELVRRPRPLPKEDAEEFARCEEVLRTGIKDFVSIGSALARIKKRKLYQGEFTSFIEYCQVKWALAPRTVYQKLAVYRANRTVCKAYKDISPDVLPTNEYQVRQLLSLRTPELQLQAWQHAVSLWESNPDRSGKITAEVVKQAVTLTQAAQYASVKQQLTASTSFSMIPWRLDVCVSAPGSISSQLVFDLQSLIDHHSESTTCAVITSPPLVLVSPHFDLFNAREMRPHLQQLVFLLHCEVEHRYIVWASQVFDLNNVKIWPSSIEVAIQVKTQEDVDEVVNYLRAKSNTPACALWAIPLEPLDIPKSLPITRLMISAPGLTIMQDDELIARIRRFVALALNAAHPVHLHTSVRSILTKPVEALPEQVKPKISKKILDAMRASPSSPFGR